MFSAESILASGRSSEKLSLPLLQSKMKCDPEGYESELVKVYKQFESFLERFRQQAAFKFTFVSGIGNDQTVVKDLGDWSMFLAHVTPFYPKQLAHFPNQLADLLHSSAHSIPSALRCHLAQALILLINRKVSFITIFFFFKKKISSFSCVGFLEISNLVSEYFFTDFKYKLMCAFVPRVRGIVLRLILLIVSIKKEKKNLMCAFVF